MFQDAYRNPIVVVELDEGFFTVGFVELLSFVHQRLLFNNIYYFQNKLAHLPAEEPPKERSSLGGLVLMN